MVRSIFLQRRDSRLPVIERAGDAHLVRRWTLEFEQYRLDLAVPDPVLFQQADDFPFSGRGYRHSDNCALPGSTSGEAILRIIGHDLFHKWVGYQFDRNILANGRIVAHPHLA